MKYLLDTTVLSDFVKGMPNVLARLKATPKRDVAVSTVTIMEIEHGLRLNAARARKLRPVIGALLHDIGVVPYEVEDARATAALRAALRKAGTPIGPFDALIAGTGLHHGLTVVTSNTTEFERVAGLNVEDWRIAV